MPTKELLLESIGERAEGGWTINTYAFVTPAPGRLHVQAAFTSRRDGAANPGADLGVDALGHASVGVNAPIWGVGNDQTIEIDRTFAYPVGGTPVTVAVKRKNQNATQTGYTCKVVYSYDVP